jgi:hypothetical protein
MEYLVAAAFTRHLVDLHVERRREEFRAIFGLIERLHIEGDDYVTTLATVGFLEDLQNENLHHHGSKPEDFEEYLGPESKWWWEELDLFWSGEIRLLGTSGRPRPT